MLVTNFLQGAHPTAADTHVVTPEEIEACREVVLSYHDAIDRGSATSAQRYVDDDAVIEMSGQTLSGDKVAAFLQRREAQRDRHTAHILVNLRVVAASRKSITLGGRLLVHARNDAGTYDVEHVLDVTHRLRPSDRGWLIVGRTAHSIHPPLGQPPERSADEGGKPDDTRSE